MLAAWFILQPTKKDLSLTSKESFIVDSFEDTW
jgi:hypothetical protein